MFLNYLKIAFRNFSKYKLDSFLNVSGLVIGMAAALLISLFVREEYSYDNQWADAERLYRLQTTWIIQGRDNLELANSTGPIKPLLNNYFETEIEVSTRLNRFAGQIQLDDNRFRERISMADPEFLDIFDLEIISGDARSALSDNSTIIISERFADKYFADQDPLGRTLTIEDMGREYTVGAVMADLPSTTHLVIDSLIAVDEVSERFGDRFTSWNEANNHIYFKLAENVDISSVNARMNDFADEFIPTGPDEGKASDTNILINTPVMDIHLDGYGLGTMKPGGDRDLVFALAVISVLIIVVAAINFINLSTARASRRAREVAMRKVLGASRKQLIAQHMGEAYVLTFVSALIAYLVAGLALPALNETLIKELQLSLSDPYTRNLIISVVLLIGTLAGLYPALVLSSFRPIKHLQANKSSETKGTTKARNMLVIFQSVVTIALIIATSVIFAQITYFRVADRGFSPENLLIINGLGAEATKPSNLTFKEEVFKLPGVESVALLQEAPTNYSEQNTSLYVPDGNSMSRVSLGRTSVGPDYFNTFKIPLLAGRHYDRERPMDIMPPNIAEIDNGEARSFILNAAAVKMLDIGTPEEAVGKVFRRNVSPNDEPIYINMILIGVVGDAQIHTIKRNPRPEMYLSTSNYYSLAVRVQGDPQGVLSAVENTWKTMYPGELFRHFYVEDVLAEEYQVEQGQMSLFLTFAVLTIVIGCLGLYGLAVFVAERRTKEIGIRKVLGARVADILRLLVWQFSKPVLVANIFAWPIAGYYMIEWLSQYPNRLESPWVGLFCIAAGLIALIIAWVTVGTQAFKVARENPIHALRYE